MDGSLIRSGWVWYKVPLEERATIRPISEMRNPPGIIVTVERLSGWWKPWRVYIMEGGERSDVRRYGDFVKAVDEAFKEAERILFNRGTPTAVCFKDHKTYYEFTCDSFERLFRDYVQQH